MTFQVTTPATGSHKMDFQCKSHASVAGWDLICTDQLYSHIIAYLMTYTGAEEGNSYASFTPNNLFPTVRSDCKKLGATPIASNGLKPIRSDSRGQIYLKIIWCE